MLDIAVPGVLGDAQAFRINFERPICKALQPGSKVGWLHFISELLLLVINGLLICEITWNLTEFENTDCVGLCVALLDILKGLLTCIMQSCFIDIF